MAQQTRVALADLPLGSLRRVEVAGLAICIARTGDGGVFAVADECTHEQYSLAEGELVGHEIECPQHSSRFDLRTGKPTGLPAVEPARVFAVHVDGGDAVIDL